VSVKIKKNFIFSTFLILFSFMTTDFILTKMYYLVISKDLVENVNQIEIKHEIFHHHLKSYSFVKKNNGKFGESSIITNSLGFRDKSKKKVNLKTKNKRIVFIGDSFTQGVLLNYDETFVGILDHNLSERGIETLNAGLSSYSPIIYYSKIKYFLDQGLEFSDLVVLVDISDIEDEAIRYTFDKGKKSVVSKDKKFDVKVSKNNTSLVIYFLKNNFFLSYSILNYFYDRTIPKKKASNFKENEISEEEFIKYIASRKYTRDKWTIDDDIYRKYQLGIDSALKNMNLLFQECNKRSINMTIIVYPWISQIFHKDLNSIHVDIWKKFSDERKINFINLFQIFINENDNDKKIMKKIKKYFIPYDVHFNQEGNKIIAKFLLNKL
jgi:lysophospholipase L1-like esterase